MPTLIKLCLLQGRRLSLIDDEDGDPQWTLNKEHWNNYFSCLHFGISNRPKTTSNSTQVILKFSGKFTSGCRLQVWVQPAGHLAITPLGCSRRQSKVLTAGSTPAQLRLVRQASTQGVSKLASIQQLQLLQGWASFGMKCCHSYWIGSRVKRF